MHGTVERRGAGGVSHADAPLEHPAVAAMTHVLCFLSNPAPLGTHTRQSRPTRPLSFRAPQAAPDPACPCQSDLTLQ